MFSLLLHSKKSPIDEASADWLFDAFAWLIEHFDLDAFRQSQLILPNNDYFPGRVNDPSERAALMLDQLKGYAGLSNWPFILVRPELYAGPKLLSGVERRVDRSNAALPSELEGQTLPVSYSPAQLRHPEPLAASLGHSIAAYSLGASGLTPPGGEEFWPETSELVAVFMGFGLLMTNTAYTFKGSCARCHNPASERQAVMAEGESVYALALYCELKGIDKNLVFKHLKKYLRGSYKQALANIRGREDDLSMLQEMLLRK